ncbi:MAG TPA: NAD-dependent epimerase/dehydratase family protein [Baekduia sp.]|nr:NAD-dependent epimerase/dehydratase family protein [Baekduia sp.]
MTRFLRAVDAATLTPARPRPERVLVTGCAGFIGSHLTESLLADGISVIGVDCFNANYGRAQKLSNLHHALDWRAFQFVPLDLARGELQDLVSEVDVVFHLAAEPGVRSSWGDRFERYVTNNIVGTQQLLRALEAAPGARLVYASSSSIYGQAETLPTSEDTPPDPVSPYGLTKLSGEHLCNVYQANNGLEVASLRYFTVFGPRQRPDMAFNIFCRAALAGEEITIHGDGRQTRDFTYVADVVAATRAAGVAAIDSGGAYNVGGGLRGSLRDVLAVIEGLAGSPLNVRYGVAQAGDVRDTGAATGKAREQLGFAPATSLQDGLAAEFEWLRAEAVQSVAA